MQALQVRAVPPLTLTPPPSPCPDLPCLCHARPLFSGCYTLCPPSLLLLSWLPFPLVPSCPSCCALWCPVPSHVPCRALPIMCSVQMLEGWEEGGWWWTCSSGCPALSPVLVCLTSFSVMFVPVLSVCIFPCNCLFLMSHMMLCVCVCVFGA